MFSILYFKTCWDHDRRIWGGSSEEIAYPTQGVKKQNYTSPFPIVRTTQRIETFIFKTNVKIQKRLAAYFSHVRLEFSQSPV